MQMSTLIIPASSERWFRRKLVDWLKRYLSAELIGAAAAILGTTLAWQLDQS